MRRFEYAITLDLSIKGTPKAWLPLCPPYARQRRAYGGACAHAIVVDGFCVVHAGERVCLTCARGKEAGEKREGLNIQ